MIRAGRVIYHHGNLNLVVLTVWHPDRFKDRN